MQKGKTAEDSIFVSLTYHLRLEISVTKIHKGAGTHSVGEEQYGRVDIPALLVLMAEVLSSLQT